MTAEELLEAIASEAKPLPEEMAVHLRVIISKTGEMAVGFQRAANTDERVASLMALEGVAKLAATIMEGLDKGGIANLAEPEKRPH